MPAALGVKGDGEHVDVRRFTAMASWEKNLFNIGAYVHLQARVYSFLRRERWLEERTRELKDSAYSIGELGILKHSNDTTVYTNCNKDQLIITGMNHRREQCTKETR